MLVLTCALSLTLTFLLLELAGLGDCATTFTYVCPNKHHVTQVLGGLASGPNGRTVVGALQVRCSSGAVSAVFGRESMQETVNAPDANDR